LTDFEHDPVTDEAAYQELRRFFHDLRKRMDETGSSPFHISLATRVSRSTLENYLTGVEKGGRFRISEDTARRLAGWAKLDLSGYQFARVPRGSMRRQTHVH
jgi:hypothetical protein